MNTRDVLKTHLLWLGSEEGGERANLRRADLREADLRWADLRRADLREADLQGANLDFSSGIPFSCGGTGFKGDGRLFAQMLFHLTRVDWSGCSGGVRETVDHITRCAAVDLFCEYREDARVLQKDE